MKQLLIILICVFSICLPASALPIVNLTESSAANGLGSYTVMIIIMAGITVAAIITAGGEADIADGDRNYLRQTSADGPIYPSRE